MNAMAEQNTPETNEEANASEAEAAAPQDAMEQLAMAAEQALEEGVASVAPEAEGGAVDAGQLALLKEENETLLAQAGAAKDQALRATAECENIRKRSQREIEDARKFALTGFARDLTAVVENLYRAASSISTEERESNASLQTLGDGVDLTLREMMGVFERNGITRVAPEAGEMFDHNLHQAMVQIETEDYPAGAVMQLMQAGYTLRDRLLQPAMVGVAKAPAGTATNADTPESGAHLDTEV